MQWSGIFGVTFRFIRFGRVFWCCVFWFRCIRFRGKSYEFITDCSYQERFSYLWSCLWEVIFIFEANLFRWLVRPIDLLPYSSTQYWVWHWRTWGSRHVTWVFLFSFIVRQVISHTMKWVPFRLQGFWVFCVIDGTKLSWLMFRAQKLVCAVGCFVALVYLTEFMRLTMQLRTEKMPGGLTFCWVWIDLMRMVFDNKLYYVDGYLKNLF